jgi:fucose permease
VLRLGSATFFTFGIVLTLLGSTQAEMARDLGLDLTASGFLGAVLALGIGAGVLVAGPLVDRFARAPLFAGACVLSAAAMFGVDSSRGYAQVVALLVVIGLGCGFYDTLVNVVVVERAGVRGASALAIVHSSATLGAAVGPLLVRFGLSHGHWSGVFHALGWVHLGLAVAGVGLGGSRPGVGEGAGAGTRTGTRTSTSTGTNRDVLPLPLTPAGTRTTTFGRSLVLGATLAAAPALLALGFVAFAYVGVENGLTIFAVPWASHLAESERAGQWSISAFWSGLLIGRLSLVIARSERGLQLLAACGIAGAAVVCGCSAFELGPLVLVMTLAGLAMGPVYPVTIALAAQRVPAAAGTALGLVAASGACGGFAIPWLVGAVGDAIGIRPALTLLGAHGLLITIAALALAKRDASKVQSVTP